MVAAVFISNQESEKIVGEIFEKLPDILDAKQLAAALQISLASAYNLLASERFPTLRVGGRKLVTKKNLLKWIKKNTNEIDRR